MNQHNIQTIITGILDQFPEVVIGILFGSASKNELTFESDVDLAVAGHKPLEAAVKKDLHEALAVELMRPVDLIDLQKTNGLLLYQAMTKGNLFYCKDRYLYGELIKKMLFNQADMMPYHKRILKERRERWISQ
jgi:uncharacterized protein